MAHRLTGPVADRAGIPRFGVVGLLKVNPPNKIALTREKQRKKNTPKAQTHPPKAQKHPQKHKNTPKKAKKTPQKIRAYARKKTALFQKNNCACW